MSNTIEPTKNNYNKISVSMTPAKIGQLGAISLGVGAYLGTDTFFKSNKKTSLKIARSLGAFMRGFFLSVGVIATISTISSLIKAMRSEKTQ